MRLSEYVNIIRENVENITQTAVVEHPIKEFLPCEMISQFQPNVWTCRKVNGSDYYVFYQGHCLNVSKLKQDLSNLYSAEGYLGKGFSKLDEIGLMTYSTTKDIIKRIFNSAFRIELNTGEVAEYLFNCENFNFTRE